jgi:hypothetical protein
MSCRASTNKSATFVNVDRRFVPAVPPLTGGVLRNADCYWPARDTIGADYSKETVAGDRIIRLADDIDMRGGARKQAS